LLDNAVKYLRTGDRVTVTLRRQLDRHVILCEVHDTGPGIPAEHLPLVTRRFYRVASEEIGGSGLGLAVVKEILRRHHSELEISSRTEGAETGTTIRFVLESIATPEDEA
jgi:two-component system phosphate regulon sensor histidine kinase PhoR